MRVITDQTIQLKADIEKALRKFELATEDNGHVEYILINTIDTTHKNSKYKQAIHGLAIHTKTIRVDALEEGGHVEQTFECRI